MQRTASAVVTQGMDDGDAEHAAAAPAPAMQRDLARLDRDWLIERQQFMIMNRYGRRYVPTPAGSLTVAVAVVGFGMVWTVTAFQMGDARAGRLDPFPFLGIVLAVLGIAVGVASYRKARRYQKAYDDYRRRRQELLADDEGE